MFEIASISKVVLATTNILDHNTLSITFTLSISSR